MKTYDILYYREITSGFWELAESEIREFSSKTSLMKHVRETKKKIASECHYRTDHDIIRCEIQ